MSHIDWYKISARSVRGAAPLANSLKEHRTEAYLYRHLATLRTDVPLSEKVEDLLWRGAHRPELTAICQEIGDEGAYPPLALLKNEFIRQAL